MTLHSKVYRGEVAHRRLLPREHTFAYPMTFFSFDLGELKHLENVTSLFGYNNTRPIQIRDQDYLRGNKNTILHQLEEYLPPATPDQQTRMVTSPKYFGYAFNPVNFYLRTEGDALLAAVAEVNNTFGDRHIYPLTDLIQEGDRHWTARCPKDFHVSPFNDMAGEYKFTFQLSEDELFIGVDLYKQGSCTMQTSISGTGHPLTNGSITSYALLRPLDTALNTMPRILWQAAKLYLRKKLEVHKRPSPTSQQTVIDRDKREHSAELV